jgi:hypothetical protein
VVKIKKAADKLPLSMYKFGKINLASVAGLIATAAG